MADTDRQVPAPDAAAWAIDLCDARGPLFVVLRLLEDDARAALADHLVEIGSVGSHEEARAIVAEGAAEHVAVVR